ncbi:MAG: prolyl oligopeptidase family serine peptidase [Akkermansiaceae bacterium]
MKSLFFLFATLVAVSDGAKVSEMKREIFKKDGKELPFRWVKTPGEGAPAMVLFLHGAGERGDNNEAQLKHGVADLLSWLAKEGKPAVVVAPQCARGVWWADLKGDFRSPDGGRLAAKPSTMMSLVFGTVDKIAKQEKVDSKRIYVTGLSMGGFGTFAAVARRPEFFAAAIPICGGGDPTKVGQMRKTPFRVYHGGADRVIPVSASKVMVDALKKAGGDVEMKVYEGVKHDSWSQTYRDPGVWKWLFEQKRK